MLSVIERVGRIEFRFDGELIQEIRVADYRGGDGDGTISKLWSTSDESGL